MHRQEKREAAGWAFPRPGHSPPALPKARGAPPAVFSPILPAGRVWGRLGSQMPNLARWAPQGPWSQLGPCVSPAPAPAQLPAVNTTRTKTGAAPWAQVPKKGRWGPCGALVTPQTPAGTQPRAQHPASLALLQAGSASPADLWLPVDLSPPCQEVNHNEFLCFQQKSERKGSWNKNNKESSCPFSKAINCCGALAASSCSSGGVLEGSGRFWMLWGQGGPPGWAVGPPWCI